jgi:hypothetical protein
MLSRPTVSTFHNFMRFEILTAVLQRIQVFWDVTLFHQVSGSWCFEHVWCLWNIRNHRPCDTRSYPSRQWVSSVMYVWVLYCSISWLYLSRSVGWNAPIYYSYHVWYSSILSWENIFFHWKKPINHWKLLCLLLHVRTVICYNHSTVSVIGGFRTLLYCVSGLCNLCIADKVMFF